MNTPTYTGTSNNGTTDRLVAALAARADLVQATDLSALQVPEVPRAHPWRRRTAVSLLAAAAAAAVAVPVGLALTGGDDSTAPEPPVSTTSADPDPEPSAPLPVPVDLEGAVADLDGDGSNDELHVDTFPNTDGMTTSYELWATLTSTGRTVSAQKTGETLNYVSFGGVVDTDGDGRNEVVLSVTPGGDLATSHVYGLVGGQLQQLELLDDVATLDVYESGYLADNVWFVGDRLLSGTTTNGGVDWQMWEWRRDGSTLSPSSLGTRCGEDPATTPPLDSC